MVETLKRTVVRLVPRYTISEAVSWVDGVSVALLLFQLVSSGLIPKDLVPAVIPALLWFGDSFSYLTSNYLIKLQELKTGAGLLKNPFHYIDSLIHPQKRIPISWPDRVKVLKDLGIEFIPNEPMDLLFRGGAYTLLGLNFHFIHNPSVALASYLTARGPVEGWFYLWPFAKNYIHNLRHPNA